MNIQQEINLSFIFANFSDTIHQEKFVELINQYMLDPMGGEKPLTSELQKQLIFGMKNHPSNFVLFAGMNNEIVGLVTCFVNFSTFKAKPYLNIHDVIIIDKFRGLGIGRRLMEKCIEISKERDYCKITLEVRNDNTSAMKLYKSLGFEESEPVMHFWTKII
jgi:ribosomal protein S18 acetylase RimI-like enzyme